VLNKRTPLWPGAWLVILACAFLVDQPISQWLFVHGFHDSETGIFKGTPWADAARFFGTYYAVIVLAGVLLLVRMLSWQRAGALLLCAATAVATDIVKWIAGRSRPVNPAGLLSAPMDFVPFSYRESGNSFPSGHAMLAFATAACLARYYPRWWPLFYAVATLVAMERVLELAHYLSDVVAAAGIGIILSQACMRALLRWFPVPPLPAVKAVEDTNT